MDDTVKTIRRQAVTFIDALQNTGGFMSVLFVITLNLISYLQRTIYYTSLVKSLYQYQSEQNKASENLGNLRQAKELACQKSLNQQNNIIEDSPQNTQLLTSDKDNMFYVNRVQRIIAQFKSRLKLKYSIRDAIHACLRKKGCIKKYDRLQQAREILFRNGTMKISKELDIRHIVKELRTVKFIQKVLLTKYQRVMIPYFKGNLLNEVASSQENKNSKAQDIKLAEFLKQALMQTHQNAFDKRLIKSIELTKEEQYQLQEVFNTKSIDIQRSKNQRNIRKKNISQSIEIEIRNQYKNQEFNIDPDEVESGIISHREQTQGNQKGNTAVHQIDISIPDFSPISISNKSAIDQKNLVQPKYLQNI
ncbi:UNKNOWN [Stylonychia lemnae]|uniref:Transmembrane protein n=1 Tax=Stylonychia lemnae TaxID=5949 RepID=A0A078AA77_STYLE|nr:UNKNOWN [Stylonychia lemnae]|eukprot:CDW78786.1 UNKNOWN [Stylonychia lemnae]